MPASNEISILKDNRVSGFSVLVTQTLGEYLKKIAPALENKGAIDGQRPALKTTAATRIRRRMVDDFRLGAVLPPVVIGIVEDDHAEIKESMSKNDFESFLEKISPERLSLIDGMQRTTAMKEASEIDSTVIDRSIRVEYWIAPSTNSLVYRMLVLNTGQVPWPLKRQLEVVYSSLVKDIEQKVSFEKFIKVDAKRRRNSGGQLSAADAVELFMSFGLRKEKVDTQEQLADEFSRLDIIEATARKRYSEEFMSILQLLVDIDVEFSRYRPNDRDGENYSSSEEVGPSPIESGKNIFDKQPARIGFVAACAQFIFGRPGKEKTELDIQKDFEKILDCGQRFLNRIREFSEEDLGAFLDLETLNSLIRARKSSKIGDFERSFFLSAFHVLIADKFELDKLTTCWRAH